MHLVGIRREMAADVPLCHAVCTAFEQAKQQAIDALSQYQALNVALPWAPADLERVRGVMGPDYWAYGFSRNRSAIEAIARYSQAQGLASRVLGVDELFAPASMSWHPG